MRLVTVCECDEPFEKAPPFLEVKALHPLNEGVVQPFNDPGTSWNFHAWYLLFQVDRGITPSCGKYLIHVHTSKSEIMGYPNAHLPCPFQSCHDQGHSGRQSPHFPRHQGMSARVGCGKWFRGCFFCSDLMRTYLPLRRASVCCNVEAAPRGFAKLRGPTQI